MGEKSKRVREALRTASIVSDRDALVKVLRKQIKRLKDEVYLLKFPVSLNAGPESNQNQSGGDLE